jgi:cation transport ATPase
VYQFNINTMFCTNCGKESKESENFCSGCGNKIAKEEQSEMERFYKLATGKEPTSQAVKDALKKVSNNTELVGEMKALEKKTEDFVEANTEEKDEEQIWIKIITGEWGLAKTFWVFGVGMFILFALFWQANQTYSGEITLAYLLYAIYSFFAFIAVGRAAYKYKGFILWKILVLIYSIILVGQTLGFIMELTGI